MTATAEPTTAEPTTDDQPTTDDRTEPARPTGMPGARKLYRSTRDAKIGGVCGGIAESMGWDPTTVRLVAALSLLLPGPQALAYIVAWIILPTDQQVFGWTGAHSAAPAPPMPAPPYAGSTF